MPLCDTCYEVVDEDDMHTSSTCTFCIEAIECEECSAEFIPRGTSRSLCGACEHYLNQYFHVEE